MIKARQMLADRIAAELCSVQPITDLAGQIFSMRARYGFNPWFNQGAPTPHFYETLEEHNERLFNDYV